MEDEQTVQKSNAPKLSDSLKSVWNTYILPEIKQIYRGPLKAFGSGDLWRFKGRFDLFYFVTVFALLAFGLAMHYSASYENFDQLLYAVVGLAVMILVSCVSVRTYREISSFFMFVALLTLVAVFFAPTYHGTHRWLVFFQPSELGKTAFIMFLAYLIDKYKAKHRQPAVFFTFILITCCVAALVLAESHLSGCILYLCIGYAMMWYGDMNKKWFAIITVFIVFVLMLIIWKPSIMLHIPGIKEYQAERIITWKKIILNQELTAKEKLDDAHQVLQSLYGIGSGGLFGVGFGNSGQKVSNLSEKANDFIFAVIAEELGFVGCICMIALFGLLIWQGFKIAEKSRTYFGSLLVMGINTQIALQVLINIAVATSILPNTGISLPFFSDGGSSMIFTLFSMGIVLGVSKDRKRELKDAE